jgi:hypothetical protein
MLLLLLALLALKATAVAAFHTSAPSSRHTGARHRHRLDAAAGTAAARVREQLVDGERDGALVVSTGRFPLIGLPAWSPPLHVGVLLSVEEKGKGRGNARTAAVGGGGGGGGGGGTYVT